MSSLVANTIEFTNVYLGEVGNMVGPMEKQGPLGKMFDDSMNDLYGGEHTFEKAERNLVKKAIFHCLNKAKLSKEQVDLMVGGDLLNQITTANFVAVEFGRPFIGVYSACSTSALGLLIGSMHIEQGMSRVLCFTSSHQATAERQYRYPLEYGIKKRPTTTYTATGAAAFLLQNQPSKIRVSKATIGKVIDYGLLDANDMGSAMAPCAYHTIKDHLKNTNTTADDYDLIITGDLSTFGHQLLIEMFKEDGVNTDHFNDCGLLLYDLKNQQVFMGGSGCACSALVLSTYLYDRLIQEKLHKILYVPTGALLSPTSTNQKESIPCIAHAIELEVVR